LRIISFMPLNRKFKLWLPVLVWAGIIFTFSSLSINQPAPFNWLDFISVASFMLSSMLLFGGILFFLTLLSSVLLRKEEKEIMKKVSIIGYTYTPVALLSLVLGLGAEMFSLLHLTGLGSSAVKGVKLVILSTGAIWSLYLSYRLTNGQLLAQIPNIIGIGIVTWAWYAVL